MNLERLNNLEKRLENAIESNSHIKAYEGIIVYLETHILSVLTDTPDVEIEVPKSLRDSFKDLVPKVYKSKSGYDYQAYLSRVEWVQSYAASLGKKHTILETFNMLCGLLDHESERCEKPLDESEIISKWFKLTYVP